MLIYKAVGITALIFLAASVARAEGNSGAPDDELEIGAIKTYPSESQARAACGKDPIVWADRYAGYIYFPREEKYGKTSEGAFACYHNAVKGNYWDTSPFSGMAQGHGPGRVFPYTPLPEPPFIGS